MSERWTTETPGLQPLVSGLGLLAIGPSLVMYGVAGIVLFYLFRGVIGSSVFIAGTVIALILLFFLFLKPVLENRFMSDTDIIVGLAIPTVVFVAANRVGAAISGSLALSGSLSVSPETASSTAPSPSVFMLIALLGFAFIVFGSVFEFVFHRRRFDAYFSFVLK